MGAWTQPPSLQSSRPELNADLKDGGRTGTARTGMRNVMVVAQVALALVLLIGAGLMLTSFSRLKSVDPGFHTTELVTVEPDAPLETAADVMREHAVRRLPVVEDSRAVGIVSIGDLAIDMDGDSTLVVNKLINLEAGAEPSLTFDIKSKRLPTMRDAASFK